MSKHFIPIELDFEYGLLAIVSNVRDYQLAWHLNKALDINLCKSDPLMSFGDGQPGAEFSFYEDYDELNEVAYYLAANRAAGSIYAPQFKQFDYFLEIKEEEYLGTFDKVLDRVRNISVIQACVEIDPRELKSPQKFVFV